MILVDTSFSNKEKVHAFDHYAIPVTVDSVADLIVKYLLIKEWGSI